MARNSPVLRTLWLLAPCAPLQHDMRGLRALLYDTRNAVILVNGVNKIRTLELLHETHSSASIVDKRGRFRMDHIFESPSSVRPIQGILWASGSSFNHRNTTRRDSVEWDSAISSCSLSPCAVVLALITVSRFVFRHSLQVVQAPFPLPDNLSVTTCCSSTARQSSRTFK